MRQAEAGHRHSATHGTWPAWLAGTFLLGTGAAAFAGLLPPAIALGYLAASCAAFVAYARDKAAARNGCRRIRERTLHLLATLGGWPGAIAGQRLLRHKSSKRPFQSMFWLTVALNCAALAWLLVSPGARPVLALLAAA